MTGALLASFVPSRHQPGRDQTLSLSELPERFLHRIARLYCCCELNYHLYRYGPYWCRYFPCLDFWWSPYQPCLASALFRALRYLVTGPWASRRSSRKTSPRKRQRILLRITTNGLQTSYFSPPTYLRFSLEWSKPHATISSLGKPLFLFKPARLIFIEQVSFIY